MELQDFFAIGKEFKEWIAQAVQDEGLQEQPDEV
jgi:hypothetical protein